MELTVLGASPACPNPGGASSGYLLHGPEGHVLLDCGHGVSGVLETVAALADVSAIVISHMHPDHFFDLIPLKYGVDFRGLPRIPLFLPPGGIAVLTRLQQAVPLNDSFYADSYELREYEPERGLDIAGIKIRFAPAHHFIPTWAMRFSAGDGKDLLYTADTGWTQAVIDLARDASTALVEATVLAHDEHTVQGHLTAAEAGKLAREAGVDRLLVTHYWEPIARRVRESAARTFGGPVELAEPRKTYPV